MRRAVRPSGGLPWYGYAVLCLLTAATLCLCVSLGSVAVPIGDTAAVIWNAMWGREVPQGISRTIILGVRLPRVLATALCGGALALCGAAMQGLLRNPLADGSTLGVSAGASLGAVTALLLGIYAQTGLTTYYGPAVVASFGEFPPFVDETYTYFTDIVTERLTLPHTLPTPPQWTDEFIDWNSQDKAKKGRVNALLTLHQGAATGTLIGGNLNTMQGIWGTKYFPEITDGTILMIEDSLKDAATVERSFSLLKCAGVFERISGLILGKHEKFDDMGTGRQPYEILQEVMGDVDFPVLAEFDCCHTHPMLTVPIGAKVRLDADAQTVTLLEE